MTPLEKILLRVFGLMASTSAFTLAIMYLPQSPAQILLMLWSVIVFAAVIASLL